MTRKERKEQRQKVIELMMSKNRDDFELGYNICTVQDYRLLSYEWLNIINSGGYTFVRSSLIHWLSAGFSWKQVAHYYRYERED